MTNTSDKRDIFIKKAQEIHCDENLDYSEVVYVNNRTPVKIIDHDIDENGQEYGVFYQTPSNHLKGQSHPRKKNKKIANTKRMVQEEVIRRFKEVHKGENLDYSEVVYVNMHTPVKIISHDLDEEGNEYGEFWQEPSAHLKGCSHPNIGKKKQIEKQTYTTDKFIEKAKSIYEDKYDYSLVDYKKSKVKVTIICKKHGPFETSPDLFLMGKGCPICGHHLSKNENEIVDLIKEKIPNIQIIQRDKKILDGKELDLFFPEYNLAIEFNGLRWHSELFNKDKNYHLQKTIDCQKKGICLIHIFEDEYLVHKELVIDKLLNYFGVFQNKLKIYGRKCLVKVITKNVAEEFLNKYHIQGFVGATVYLGAFYDDELIGVMNFKEEVRNSGKWDLNRFATNLQYVCCGIGGKILHYFIKNYNPIEIKSFLDRRWMFKEDNLYTKLGFEKNMILGPQYTYTNGHSKRLHKFNFRKQILHKKYGLDLSMTESEMTESLGYYKLWDCGLIKYVWTKKADN